MRGAYAILTRLHVSNLNGLKGALVTARVEATLANVALYTFIIHILHLLVFSYYYQ